MDSDSEVESEASAAKSDAETTASSATSTVKGKSLKRAANVGEKRTVNTTGESLYEDAVQELPNRVAPKKDPELPASQQSDATFVSSTDQSANEPLEPRGTYVVPTATISAASADTNETFCVENGSTSAPSSASDQTVFVATAKRQSATSIMTEDDSDSSTNSPGTYYKKTAQKIVSGTLRKTPQEIFK